MSVFFVSPIEVAIDALAASSVIGVVRVVETEAFEGAKISLDGVEPTGIGGCPDETDIMLLSKLLQGVMTMRGQIVQNQIDARLGGITSP
jgi:hypothetical protein